MTGYETAENVLSLMECTFFQIIELYSSHAFTRLHCTITKTKLIPTEEHISFPLASNFGFHFPNQCSTICWNFCLWWSSWDAPYMTSIISCQLLPNNVAPNQWWNQKQRYLFAARNTIFVILINLKDTSLFMQS